VINWTAIDPKSRKGRFARMPARLLPKSTVMHIRRGPARDMKWVSGSATHGCWLGTYELEKQNLIERFVRPGMTVYDVGAQAGFYSLICSRLAGDNGRVYSFEPDAREARYLSDHVRINSLRNVHIVQAAVGAEPGLSEFSTDRGPCQNRLTNNGGRLLVPVLSLDTAGLPAPDLIKMDIEGGESDALRGARKLLCDRHVIILIALHGAEHAGFCPKFLRSLGYEVFDLQHHRVEGVPATDEIYATPASALD
jgi:FkbM family methyltransferase